MFHVKHFRAEYLAKEGCSDADREHDATPGSRHILESIPRVPIAGSFSESRQLQSANPAESLFHVKHLTHASDPVHDARPRVDGWFVTRKFQ